MGSDSTLVQAAGCNTSVKWLADAGRENRFTRMCWMYTRFDTAMRRWKSVKNRRQHVLWIWRWRGVFVAESTSASVEVLQLCQAEMPVSIAPGTQLRNLCEAEMNDGADWNAEKYRRSVGY